MPQSCESASELERAKDTGSRGLGWRNPESDTKELSYPDMIVKQIKAIRASDSATPPSEQKHVQNKTIGQLLMASQVHGPALLPNPSAGQNRDSQEHSDISDIQHAKDSENQRLGETESSVHVTSAVLNRPPPDYYKNRRMSGEKAKQMDSEMRGEIIDIMEKDFTEGDMQGHQIRGRDIHPGQRGMPRFERLRPALRRGLPPRANVREEEVGWREDGRGMWPTEDPRNEGKKPLLPPRSMGLLGDRPPSHSSLDSFSDGHDSNRKPEEGDPHHEFKESGFHRDSFRQVGPGDAMERQQDEERRQRFLHGREILMHFPDEPEGRGVSELENQPLGARFEEVRFRETQEDSPDRGLHRGHWSPERRFPPDSMQAMPLHGHSLGEFPPRFPPRTLQEGGEDVHIVTRQDSDDMLLSGGGHPHHPGPPPPGSQGLGSVHEASGSQENIPELMAPQHHSEDLHRPPYMRGPNFMEHMPPRMARPGLHRGTARPYRGRRMRRP